jgi:hypothetical protein
MARNRPDLGTSQNELAVFMNSKNAVAMDASQPSFEIKLERVFVLNTDRLPTIRIAETNAAPAVIVSVKLVV